MKKTFAFSILFLTILAFYSCKEKSNNKDQEQKIAKISYAIDIEKSHINWTAYKTSEKVPVKGKFNKFNIENVQNRSGAVEALDGLKFSIPVSSIFSNDSIRDGKLNKFFFGIMKNTELISGTLSLGSENSGVVDLTMNGITNKLPVNYTLNGEVVTIKANMSLDNWQAQLAIEALNEACKLLHTGADGIPKTWSEVDIEVSAHLKKE